MDFKRTSRLVRPGRADSQVVHPERRWPPLWQARRLIPPLLGHYGYSSERGSELSSLFGASRVDDDVNLLVEEIAFDNFRCDRSFPMYRFPIGQNNRGPRAGGRLDSPRVFRYDITSIPQ